MDLQINSALNYGAILTSQREAKEVISEEKLKIQYVVANLFIEIANFFLRFLCCEPFALYSVEKSLSKVTEETSTSDSGQNNLIKEFQEVPDSSQVGYQRSLPPIIKEIKEIEKINEELHFSLNVVNFLAKNSFGLRHVSDRKRAQHEGNFGFYDGCSLALVPQKFEDQSHQPWLNPSLQFNEEDAADFEARVDGFIKGSIVYDICNTNQIEINKTKYIEIADIINCCCFSIIDNNGFGWIEDMHVWQGLGRFPKNSINGERITPLPFLSRGSLGYSAEKFEEVIKSIEDGDAMVKKITTFYRTVLIQTIQQELMK